MNHHKDLPILPLGVSDYETMCATPGIVLVDKSRYVSAMLSQFSKSCVNIIRAPQGFGRTTFLSTLSAYFDPLSPHSTFAPDIDCDKGCVSEARGRLLVFNLDLNRIDWRTDPDTHVRDEECCRALDEAACDFYARYRTLLEAPNSKYATSGFEPTFANVLWRARARRWEVFFAVDNYNAVIRNDPYGVFQDAISRAIFDLLASMVVHGSLSYGLIVGETIVDAPRWRRVPSFFVDITDSGEFDEAFGFTMDEVCALGATLALDLQAELAPIWAKLDLPEGARIMYCPSDVLSMARDMLEGRHSSARVDEVRYVVLDPVRPPTPVQPFEFPCGYGAESLDSLMFDDPELPDYQPLDEETDADSDEPMSEPVADAFSDGTSAYQSSAGDEHVESGRVDVLPSMLESMTLSCYDRRH